MWTLLNFVLFLKVLEHSLNILGILHNLEIIYKIFKKDIRYVRFKYVLRSWFLKILFKITQPNWPEYTWILNDFFFVNLALQTEQWYGLIPGWSFIKCSSILIVVGKSIWHIGHVKRVVFTSFFTPNWLIIWFSLNFLNSESKFLRSDSKCLGKGSYIA